MEFIIVTSIQRNLHYLIVHLTRFKIFITNTAIFPCILAQVSYSGISIFPYFILYFHSLTRFKCADIRRSSYNDLNSTISRITFVKTNYDSQKKAEGGKRK